MSIQKIIQRLKGEFADIELEVSMFMEWLWLFISPCFCHFHQKISDTHPRKLWLKPENVPLQGNSQIPKLEIILFKFPSKKFQGEKIGNQFLPEVPEWSAHSLWSSGFGRKHSLREIVVTLFFMAFSSEILGSNNYVKLVCVCVFLEGFEFHQVSSL